MLILWCFLVVLVSLLSRVISGLRLFLRFEFSWRYVNRSGSLRLSLKFLNGRIFVC